MFNWEVCLLTLQQMGSLMCYIALGYGLRRFKVLPQDADQTLSKLVTMLFCPAYNIANLSVTMTPENLGSNLKLLGFGTVIIFTALALAFGLSRFLGRSPLEKRSLTYAFTFTNYGYFGYPLVAGVFGTTALGQLMSFCIIIALVTNTAGYLLFAGKLSWRKILLSPLILAVVIGVMMGLCRVRLPQAAQTMLTGMGNCMSPVSMLLAGFVLGAYPLKQLLSGTHSWLCGAIRLLAIPALFVGALYLLGARGMYLLIPGAFLALPPGLNMVVFPASFGHDTRDNAKLCFVSHVLALPILPLAFAALQALSEHA